MAAASGSWGQSQVDLTQVGVKPGDTIRLRFDFGMDGCTGVDGWYVDDVKVRACNTKKNVTLKQDRPEKGRRPGRRPSLFGRYPAVPGARAI